MSVSDTFAHFFKPEVRNEAADLLSKKHVYLQIGSDTQIDASVRGTTPSKISFRSDSIESETFEVDCSCKASKKGVFCKHIWAVLTAAQETSADFFENKTNIEKGDLLKSSIQNEKLKEKQSEYRKQAYEAQKQRAKNLKDERKSRDRAESIKSSAFTQALPDEVKSALAYFELNGFPMTLPVDEPTVTNAKRVLSRVFHPDKGGAHDEMLELLRNADLLLKFRL